MEQGPISLRPLMTGAGQRFQSRAFSVDALRERVADVCTGFVLRERQAGDVLEVLERIDRVDVVIAVYVAEDIGRLAGGLRGGNCCANHRAVGLLVEREAGDVL